MTLVLISLAAAAVVEALVYLEAFWRARRLLSAILAIALGIMTGWLLAAKLDVATVIFAVFSFYRIVNLLRLKQNRLQPDFLYNAARKTSLWLIFLQVATLATDRLVSANYVNILTCFYLVAASQLLAGSVILSSTLRNKRTTKAPFLEKNIPSRDLPTITVAIPARNETRDLEECLRSLVQSNYPKLEILVLDDNSQDRRTPEIIRGFAQQGVRFLQGKQPPKDWLAKNYAYQQLAQESNGRILLFCGVDTRFQPDSLNTLVTNMIHKNKTMVSVMPQNANSSLGSLLLQPARYAWELSLPRRMMRRPPVLSTCWLITRDVFKASGGFKAVSRKIVPESYFARFAAANSDGYSFMRSDAAIGLASAKTVGEQLSTSVRTRYPQLHRRPELVALTMMSEFVVLVWPLLVGILAIASQEWILGAISIAGFLLVAFSYGNVASMAYGHPKPLGPVLLPVAAIWDIFLLNYSMWQYEFSQVLWKGRNVSLPVMRVVQSLPGRHWARQLD
jgi:hypothetical protein